MSLFESAPKQVSETCLLKADFIGQLASGVTISSAAVSQYVYSGAVSTLTLGTPSISGSVVSVSVAGGTAGVLYQVSIQATLSDGQVIRMRTLLAVVSNAI